MDVKVYTKEDKKRIVEEQLASGLSQREFAEKADLPLSTVTYWVKQYRPRAATKTAVTRDELTEAREEIASLKFVRDELMGKLEDAYTKIRSLQNVVVILGHQVGDDA